jgi:hypothetical protein
MKVEELQGAQLDYWVARAEGIDQLSGFRMGPEGPEREFDHPTGCRVVDHLMYSVSWRFAGPIIERHGIGVALFQRELWRGCAWDDAVLKQRAFDYAGPTPLIAAMRAYVASKFGDEVPAVD